MLAYVEGYGCSMNRADTEQQPFLAEQEKSGEKNSLLRRLRNPLFGRVSAYVEGYGCSMNRADTEQIRGALASNGFGLCDAPERADVLVINTCAVKQPTENHMLRRISQLSEIAEKGNSRLFVFGCLSKISPAKIISVSQNAQLVGPSMAELMSKLNLAPKEFSPGAAVEASNKSISIITIARGCAGKCAFCCVRNARGGLKSYPAEQIAKRFRKDVAAGIREFWLTAQDTAAYGLDIGSSLPELLKVLLETKGDYRIRIGMMNPNNLMKIYGELMQPMRDSRIYKFLHVPLQSGSDSVLGAMGRNYTSGQFLALVKNLRKDLPGATISTDVIVGFPGESEGDFAKTERALKTAEPDIVNISRYGNRPGTAASEMPSQLHGSIKKERSRKLSVLCSGIALKRNRMLVGTEHRLLVSERGAKGGFIGRTENYKPVVIGKCCLGSFVDVRVASAFPCYLSAEC